MLHSRKILEMNPSLVKVGYQERCVLRNSLEHEVTVTGVTGTQRLNIHTEASHPAAFIKVNRTEEDQQEDYIDISISTEEAEVRCKNDKRAA